MDVSLCLYKGKLKEALTLVPNMSSEKKAEAVQYWNVLAEQLAGLVQEDPRYNQETIIPNHQHIDDLIDLVYDGPEGRDRINIDALYGDDTNVMSTMDTTPTTDSTLVTPSMKQTTSNQFQIRDNFMDKTLFESAFVSQVHADHNIDDNPSNMIEEKLDHTPINDLADINSTTFAITTQPSIDCISRASAMCTSDQDSPNIRSSVNYDTLKQPSNMLAQVSSHPLSPRKSIIGMQGDTTNDIFCSTIDVSQQNSNSQLMSYMQNGETSLTSTVNKLHQPSVSTDTSYTSVMITSTLSCPRTRANISDEIGNGQYDRGPKTFDEVPSLTHFIPEQQSLGLSSVINQNVITSTRNEMFTQSERPLQPIQLFSSNNNDFTVSNPYNLVNNRLRYMFCDICSESLDGPDDLEKHQVLHSLEKGSMSPNLDKSKSASLSSIEVKIEAMGRVGDQVSNSNQHTCEVCGKSGFSTKGNLKRHLRAHSGEKPFKCEYCDSCFTEKKSLKIHVRRHTGEKPYKCQICGKLFSQTGVLQSHMALHLNQRKYECHKCGKAFRQRSQLNLHIMRHEGVKRLECATCLAKFLTKGDLERHCRIHTGERPYACKICSKTFTRQQSLNEHMNRHTGRKPYDCKYCDKTFSEMSACYKHAKTHKRQDQLQQQQKKQQIADS